MSRIVHRVVAFLLSILLLAGTPVAVALKVHGGACCGETAAATLPDGSPCHDFAGASGPGCGEASHDVDPAGPACGDGCSSCAGHSATSPVGVTASVFPALAVRTSLERTSLRPPVAPPGHPERLERPPSLVSLNA
jgi:hypothetical protein